MSISADEMIEADDGHATSDDPAYLRLRDAGLAFAMMTHTLKTRGDVRFADVDPLQLLGVLDDILEAHYGTEKLPSKEIH